MTCDLQHAMATKAVTQARAAGQRVYVKDCDVKQLGINSDVLNPQALRLGDHTAWADATRLGVLCNASAAKAMRA